MAGGWDSLGLCKELVTAAEESYAWFLPMAVQDDAIPLILGGSDVMVSSETGSGKTASYVMPILQLCMEQSARKNRIGDSTELQFKISECDRDKNLTVDSQGLFVKSEDPKRWVGCRARCGVKKFTGASNKYYFECTILGGGIVRLGMSTSDANLELGTDQFGYGFGATGVKVHASKFEEYFPAGFTTGDVVGCLVDFTVGKFGSISYFVNGKNLGEAFALENDHALFPALCIKNSQCWLNFGKGTLNDFRYPPADCFCTPFSSAVPKSGCVENPNDASAATAAADKKEGPIALVILPTKDLARQSFQVFSELSKFTKETVSSFLIVGGGNLKPVTDALKSGLVDVLVGTPKIISSFADSGKLRTSRCRILVLDEADSLAADREILDPLRRLFSKLPTGTQTCLFSATLHDPSVKKLAAMICYNPLLVDLVGDTRSVPETIVHCLVRAQVTGDHFENIVNQTPVYRTDAVHCGGLLANKVDWNNIENDDRTSEHVKLIKPRILLELLEKTHPDQVLVFVRTNLDANLLEEFLNAKAKQSSKMLAKTYCCKVLAGKRSLEERQKNLKAFNDGDVRVLIATDVAARGIDVPQLPCVVNYTFPDSVSTYIHRVGRVGRNGRKGIAISIIPDEGITEKVWYCQPGNTPPCTDCRLFKDGGNCIWYNEPYLLRDVRNKLKETKFLDISYPNIVLPAEVDDILSSQSLQSIEEATSSSSLTTRPKLVQEIVALETKLQWDFFALQQKLSASNTITKTEQTGGDVYLHTNNKCV